MGVRPTGSADVPPQPDDSVGKLLNGKYLLLEVLGAGGMGCVYVAENVSIGRRVAVKVLHPAYAGHAEATSRFQREARAAAQIGHPHIIEVFDLGRTEQGVPYIVMELLEGEDLLKRLGRLGRIPPDMAVDVILQVLSAIGVAHAIGVVHRDLKPENIFLSRRGERDDYVKVLDFGVAKFHEAVSGTSGRLTRDGSLVGTPAYMSPEQARGNRKIDARSDLYATGVVLYEMLSGRLPHQGETYNEMIFAIAGTDPPPLSEVAPWVPPRLAQVVARAMARDPDKRYQTASQLSDALEPFVDATEIDILLPATRTPGPSMAGPPTIDLPRPAPRESMSTVAHAPAKSGRAWIAAGVVGLLVAAGGFALWMRQSAQADPPAAGMPGVAAASVTATPATAAGPATARTGFVSLDVESSAPGARVLLDGAPVGPAPVHTVVPERDGTHVLRVEAPGFEPAERSVPLSGPVRILVELQRTSPVAPTKGRPTTRPPGKRGPSLVYDEDVY